jgi:uncharacterized protein YdeI (YjbR/CyaY-like superfamily)
MNEWASEPFAASPLMPGKDSKTAAAAQPLFFPSPGDFRAWLEENHHKQQEQLVGFYKKDSGKPSITWAESVDQALCFGWIDGVRRSLDGSSYTIRFTPRKSGSTWSAINIKRVGELTAAGLMRPAGLKAFEARLAHKSAIYSYEQRQSAEFSAEGRRRFQANKKAWEFFQRQPPGYRRLCTFWVMSAKQDETRMRRLDRLIADSAAGQRIRELARPQR